MKRCAITDGSAETRPDWLVRRCAELAAAGVDLLLVRERALGMEALAGFVRRVVAVAGKSRVLVAGPPAVALAAGAAGVHLSTRPGELTPAEVRAQFPGAFVSQSCHSLAEVLRARELGVDAILFGPVFGKWVGGVEVVPGVGLQQLREAVETAGEVPVYALGGVTEENAALCQSPGIAAIRMFFASGSQPG